MEVCHFTVNVSVYGVQIDVPFDALELSELHNVMI